MGVGGTVIYVNDTVTGAGGKYITIQYADGITVSYCHLSKTNVSKDQVVKQGQSIAVMGNTAFGIQNMAVHLHITVKKDGRLIDPVALINEGKIEYLNPPNPIPKRTQ